MAKVIIKCKKCPTRTELHFDESVKEAHEILDMAGICDPVFREFTFTCPTCGSTFDGVAKIHLEEVMTPILKPVITIARYL